MLTQDFLNLDSPSSPILLNPRMSLFEQDYLRNLVERVPTLESHVWLASSGSSGRVKMLALSKNALKASARAVNKHLQAVPGDCWAAQLPDFHVGGLSVWLRASLSQSRVAEYPLEKWTARNFAAFCEAEEITLVSLAPSQLYEIAALEVRAPQTLRAAIVGGVAAWNATLCAAARRLAWPVLPSYGLSESASQVASAALDSWVDPCAPLPRPRLLEHVQARVNEAGFLELKGPSLFTAYARDTGAGPELWDPKVDGWFTTRDRAEIEVVEGGVELIEIRKSATGSLKVRNKSPDLARLDGILSKLCRECEQKLEAGLALATSQGLGYELHLIVTPVNANESVEGSARELFESFNSQLAPFERACAYHVWPALPKNAQGEFQRDAAAEAIRNPKKIPVRWATR
jgi:O-succinylbenzoic acid--CoA ligase